MDVTLLIQAGEELIPVVTAGIDVVKAFVALHNGNGDVLTQLEANATTITQDETTVDAEIAAAAASS